MKYSMFFRKRPQLLEIVSPLNKFVKLEAFSGLLLIFVAIMAMVIANSPLSELYFGFFQKNLTLSFEDFEISKPLILWINDGLMAIFFFLVGLEIKRETQTGELSTLKKAALPAFAALGGMAFPAAFFLIFNYSGEGAAGWGIPMATDIAFALGVLTILGSRVPVSLKLFLTALAIVDDLGAVIVIALFYTAKIEIGALMVAGLVFAILLILNSLKVYRISIYLFLGIVLWIALLKSGVHATIAGVLLAMAIPGKAKATCEECIDSNQAILNKLKNEQDLDPDDPKKSKKLVNAIFVIEDNFTHSVSPLLRLEHSLHSWVAYFIIPVFAFANAGIVFNTQLISDIGNPIALGIFAGLVLGKPIGIALFTWFVLKLKWSEMPLGVTWGQIIGVGILGGIGFTMSIFINNLAFAPTPLNIEVAKIGILVSSLIAGIIGFLVLFSLSGQSKK